MRYCKIDCKYLKQLTNGEQNSKRYGESKFKLWIYCCEKYKKIIYHYGHQLELVRVDGCDEE